MYSEGVGRAATSVRWTPLWWPVACRAQATLPVPSFQWRVVCRVSSANGCCHPWGWTVSLLLRLPCTLSWAAWCGLCMQPLETSSSASWFLAERWGFRTGGQVSLRGEGSTAKAFSSGKVFFSWGGRSL